MTDTPAQTAEERAQQILLEIGPLDDWNAMGHDDAVRLIASAITQAEDAAYERAARAVDALQQPQSHFTGYTYWCTHVDALDEASAWVRSLKSEKELP